MSGRVLEGMEKASLNDEIKPDLAVARLESRREEII